MSGRRACADPAAEVAFCGRCGTRPAGGRAGRVCADCGMGVVLRAAAELAPEPGAAFLVVDRALAVCALSEAAERLLGVGEDDAVHRHVAELLRPRAGLLAPADDLAAVLARAAAGEEREVRAAGARVVSDPARALRLRIGSCGPPPAALVVIDG